VFRVQNSEHVSAANEQTFIIIYIVQTISLTKAGMVTAKERALAWGRDIQEASSRARRELERDEQELAELEILMAAAEVSARTISSKIVSAWGVVKLYWDRVL
jgi:hypothetical protein